MTTTTPSADLIDAYLAHLILTDRSSYTTVEWRRILSRVDRDLPHGLDHADHIEIQRWLGRPGWSRATRRTYWTALSRFYAWACDPDDPWLSVDPMARVEAPSRPTRGTPRVCTDQDVAAVLARARAPYRLWVLCAAYLGARCIEIARLDREHIGPERTELWGKGDRRRSVPTHPAVWAAVEDLAPGPLVTRRDGTRVDGRYISHTATEWLHRDLGMPHLSLHRLRGWYATRTLEACRDLRVVQELLGHASPATTQIYTLVTSERRAEAVAALPTLG